MVTWIPLAGNPKGIQLIVVETVFLALDIIAVGLRLWARRLKRKSLGLNDYAIIVALFLTIARYVNEVLALFVGGLGLHAKYVLEVASADTLGTFGKMAFAADLLWFTLVALIKISILDLYKTIFANTTFRHVANGIMCLCAVTAVAFIIERSLICRPLAYNWDTTINGRCGDIRVQYIAIVSIDMVIDLIIIALPMPVLWRLQMSLTKKIAIMAVFSLGFFIGGITAARIKFVVELQLSDPTDSFVEFAIFAALEPLLGIINACLPVLPPVFPKIVNYVSSVSSRISRKLKGASYDGSWPRLASTQPKRSDPQVFGHPDDYPLIDVLRGVRLPSLGRLPAYTSQEQERQASRVIKVTTDWTVRSNTDDGTNSQALQSHENPNFSV